MVKGKKSMNAAQTVVMVFISKIIRIICMARIEIVHNVYKFALTPTVEKTNSVEKTEPIFFSFLHLLLTLYWTRFVNST